MYTYNDLVQLVWISSLSISVVCSNPIHSNSNIIRSKGLNTRQLLCRLHGALLKLLPAQRIGTPRRCSQRISPTLCKIGIKT